MKTAAKTSFVLGSLAALLAAGPFERVAHADEKEACVTASDQAQTFRDELKFRRAREALLTCARDVCPGIVRKDCEKWLSELDASQPTVVFGARDAKGRDVAGVRVSMDGTQIVDHIEGKAVAVDPGEHLFKFEAAGNAASEERVVVRVGEKNRFLTVQMRALGEAGPAVASTASTASTSTPGDDNASTSGGSEGGPKSEPSKSSLPIVPIVLVGVGVVGLMGFTYFGLTGRSDVSDLRSTCAPHCNQSDVDAAKSKLLIADVSLGVGVVAIGAAVVMLLTQSSPSLAATTVGSVTGPKIDVRALPGGGVASFGATF